MSGIKGNYIKTSLFVGDVREDVDPAVNRVDMMTIQSYDYSIGKGRNSNGDPHGGVVPTALNFVIRTPKSVQSRRIYKLLRDGEPMKLSFVFNPHYDLNDDLDGYYAATIVTGVVASAREEYSLQQGRDNETRVVLCVSLMIHSISYVGSSNEHVLRFK